LTIWAACRHWSPTDEPCFSGRSSGQPHTAVIVEAKDRPGGRAVKYGDQLFASLSAAGKAVTGHPTNGWVFWHPAETGEQ
jgi:hypothetical protein